jgi:hypothetical protein
MQPRDVFDTYILPETVNQVFMWDRRIGMSPENLFEGVHMTTTQSNAQLRTHTIINKTLLSVSHVVSTVARTIIVDY